VNNRTCAVWVKICGTLTPPATCGDRIYNLRIPPGVTVNFLTPNAILGSPHLVGSMPPFISGPLGSFRWNYAEVQNQDCCSGGGLGIGGNLPCTNPVTGKLTYPGPGTVLNDPPGSMSLCGYEFYANWDYPNAPFDDVVLTLFEM
jgi:hypothetical protein